MWKIIGFLVKSSLFLLLAWSCSSDRKSMLVAKVGDASLYKGAIDTLTQDMSSEDSIYFTARYVRSWIRNELLLNKAKMNLTDDELNVEQQVKSYRESLIISQYKQKYIMQHLDTVVSNREVRTYIKKYPANFKLSTPIYQFYFAKVLSKNKSDIKLLKKIFSEKKIDLTRHFNLSTSSVLVSYDEYWYPESEVLDLLPQREDKKKIDLKGIKKYMMLKDKGTTYFIKIKARKPKGAKSPVAYVLNKVKEIIIHKRKIKIAKELEYDIYEDAKKNHSFELH